MKSTQKENACLYVVGTGVRNLTSGRNETYQKFCNKIQAEDSEFCPKHVLIAADKGEESHRRALRGVETKKAKKERLEFLKTSPLAAVNPAFDAPHKSGYER